MTRHKAMMLSHKLVYEQSKVTWTCRKKFLFFSYWVVVTEQPDFEFKECYVTEPRGRGVADITHIVIGKDAVGKIVKGEQK